MIPRGVLVLTASARGSKLARMRRFFWLYLVLTLVAAAPARADEAPSLPPKSAAEQTNELFDRLAKSRDPQEAAGIESAIERLRMRSGSDTDDLLMGRAIEAMQQQNNPLALSLLDALVDLAPDWAEAWNKRATVRYFEGDSRGSMRDIARTLKLEPRHIGALAGMGAILSDAGLLDEAARAYDRALTIAPEYQVLRDAADRVKAKLAGRSL